MGRWPDTSERDVMLDAQSTLREARGNGPRDEFLRHSSPSVSPEPRGANGDFLLTPRIGVPDDLVDPGLIKPLIPVIALQHFQMRAERAFLAKLLGLLG